MLRQKKIIAILGIGRSGTSVTAKALHTLGVSLGTNLMLATHENPKGFWEDNDIKDINENVLRSLNLTWDTLGFNHTHINVQDARLKELNESALQVLNNRLQNIDYWGFKHPRTARLLPFWQAHFNSMHLDDSYIISIRNPLSTSNSSKLSAAVDTEKMLLLWLLHLVPVINQTKGKKRVVVSYESMLNNPTHELDRIKKALDIQYNPTQIEIDSFVNGFLTKDLNRHAMSYETFKSHPATPKLCLIAYDLLNKLAHDELSFDDPDFISAWTEVSANLDNLSPLYSYMDNILSHNLQLTNHTQVLKSQLADHHQEVARENTMRISTIMQLQDKISTLETKIRYLTLNGLLKIPMRIIHKLLRMIITR